jgi:TRAP-type C4-dicarboxylate transport system permease small subunit
VNKFEKLLGSVTGKVAYGAIVALVVCVGLVVANVVKRSLGLGLISGTNELVTLLAACILGLGIPYLTSVKGHVAVGILVDRLAPRKQAVFDVVTYAISIAIGILITRALVELGQYNQASGWHTGVLRVPFYYFVYMLAGSLALTCVVLIKDLARVVINVVKGSKAT